MQYALVSGGSKGIGFAIAMALAKRKFNVILIARDREALETAAKKLTSEYKIQVETLCFDLSLHESAETIANWCTEKNIEVKILCNVTGIGGSKDYPNISVDDARYMLCLNTDPAIALTLSLLPLLQKNSPAYILNVSSMAGLAPVSVKNVYSAVKSAVIFFSYSLRSQLKKDNISVSCLCPGPVFTKPSIEEDTIKKLGWLGKQMAVSAAQAGETAVQKTLNKKMLIVPGRLASLLAYFLRLAPPNLINFMQYRYGSEK